MTKYDEEKIERALELALAYEDEEEYINTKLRKSQRREKDQNDRKRQKNKNYKEW